MFAGHFHPWASIGEEQPAPIISFPYKPYRHRKSLANNSSLKTLLHIPHASLADTYILQKLLGIKSYI